MLFSQKKQSPKWRLYKRYSGFRAIISALDEIPSKWVLTPLREKRPYRKEWQYEPPIERSGEASAGATCLKTLLSEGEPATSKRTGKPYTAYISGVGLRTGKYSGGLLAIDIDGVSPKTALHR